MDKIPKRTKLAGVYRKMLDKYEASLIFPFKNPSYYQVMGILFSIVFLFFDQTLVKILILLIILMLDWYDGAAARKFGYCSKQGWMIDVTTDRITEGLILISEISNWVGRGLFFLYIINILLSFYSLKSGKHMLVAVKFFYLIVLILRLF